MSEKSDKVKRGGRKEAEARAGRRPTNPRARAIRAVAPDVKRDRVFRIAGLLATGEWNRKVSRQLAEEWKLAPLTVRWMAAEASRLLEYTTGDRKKLMDASRVRLQQIAAQDGPDRVQAVKVLFESLGELRKRVEVSGPGGGAVPIDATAKVVVLPAVQVDDAGDGPTGEGESGA